MNERCQFYEWDEESFILPDKFILDGDSDLASALNVFYQAGGYDFFNVIEAEYYASNWLDFVGNLYDEIMDGKYSLKGRQFVIPLTVEQKQELLERGVPEVFLTDIKK